MTSKAYRENYALIEWKPLPVRTEPTKEQANRGLYFIPDITPYRSPIDGSVIGGRRQHRDHMRAHDVIEVGNEKPVPFKPKPLPDVREDIRAARQMVESGYKPRPRETFNPREFD